jgi:ATP phosphoribosyltransferase
VPSEKKWTFGSEFVHQKKSSVQRSYKLQNKYSRLKAADPRNANLKKTIKINRPSNEAGRPCSSSLIKTEYVRKTSKFFEKGQRLLENHARMVKLNKIGE